VSVASHVDVGAHAKDDRLWVLPFTVKVEDARLRPPNGPLDGGRMPPVRGPEGSSGLQEVVVVGGRQQDAAMLVAGEGVENISVADVSVKGADGLAEPPAEFAAPWCAEVMRNDLGDAQKSVRLGQAKLLLIVGECWIVEGSEIVGPPKAVCKETSPGPEGC